MLKLSRISEVKTEKTRSDAKASRQYYTAYFMDGANPFAKPVQRNIFQAHNEDGTIAGWKGGNPADVSKFVGKEIPGKIVNCTVVPYQIGERTVNSYTTALLDGENLVAILKQNGHTLESSPAKAETVSVGAEEALNGK